MTFKDKFTNRFNPFHLKKKLGGWTHFSGIYLTVFLLFLMVLRRTFVFFLPKHGHVGASHTAVKDIPKPS